jgi:molybdopterin synthase catalytic subunit
LANTVALSQLSEGVDACQYDVDLFKQKVPSKKNETYQDGGFK